MEVIVLVVVVRRSWRSQGDAEEKTSKLARKKAENQPQIIRDDLDISRLLERR
jgi:hypothetical protein